MRVIIVDDEPDILEDIKINILKYNDFEVIGTYQNPFKAFEAFEGDKPDIAFLDIEMPGMSGIDLAEKFLEVNSRIKIIFITAFNHYATQAFEVNALDYILKPIHPHRMRKAIERLGAVSYVLITPMEHVIRIRTFGCFEIQVDGIPIKWNRSKAKELLAYLLHFEGVKKTKYKICEELWPEYEPKKALVNLQTAMCSLRKSLGNLGIKDIKIEFIEESYILKLGNVLFDAREFEKLYKKGKKNRETAKEAVQYYKGDYMESEDWIWAQLASESFAGKYEELLMFLVEDSYIKNDYSETVERVIQLARRQAIEGKLQLILAEVAYLSKGKTGLKHNINILRNIFFNEYDMDLEPEVYYYCKQKGISI